MRSDAFRNPCHAARIGRAIVTRPAADGAAVVLTYATERLAAEDLAAEITDAGGWARALQLDLRELDQLLGRIGRPEDIADLAALVIHPDSRWITGQNVRADGGRV